MGRSRNGHTRFEAAIYHDDGENLRNMQCLIEPIFVFYKVELPNNRQVLTKR